MTKPLTLDEQKAGYHMSIIEEPLRLLFPNLNSLQITKLREFLKTLA